MNLQEIKAKVAANEHINYHDLAAAIEAEKETARFMVPLHRVIAVVVPGLAMCDGGERDMVLCRVDERRYKVADRYKVGFVPVAETPHGSETFYLMDLSQLIRSGHVKIV